MNGKCFEVGTIQAFLDGETAPDVSARLTDHVASCDACALKLADAEEENSVVFSTLERELNALVPTQRLWTRINDSIAVEQSRTPVWQKILVYVRTSLTNPSIAAAAGILIVLGMFAFVVRVNDDAAGIVMNRTFPGDGGVKPADVIADIDIATTGSDPLPTGASSSSSGIESSALPVKDLKALAESVRANRIQPQQTVYREPISADGYLPGEESYVKTISDLKQNVDEQKDTVLTPSTRVSYERDMAVVDNSIKRMRDEVKKNPRNQAARQVLYASYQDKIDLLNSVAQREELIASLK